MPIMELTVEISLATVIFEAIYDEISEIAYIKQFDSIFDNEKYRDFSDINLMREEVNAKYDQLTLALD